MEPIKLKLTAIILQQRLNPRQKLSAETIERYMHVIGDLPPIVVQQQSHVLIDGFHRYYAHQKLGLESIQVLEIEVNDSQLFAEACRRNLAHGLPLTKEERNAAIVRLYRTGFKQNGLAKMFGVSQSQISFIIGADERTCRILPGNNSLRLTPKHEQLIRKAPKPHQDLIAKVILTREEVSPPNKSSDEFPIATSKRTVLSIVETARLVNMVVETPALAQPLLTDLLNNPQEKRIVRNATVFAKTQAQMIAEWYDLYRRAGQLRKKYGLGELAKGLTGEMNAAFQVADAIHFLEKLLTEIEFVKAQNER